MRVDHVHFGGAAIEEPGDDRVDVRHQHLAALGIVRVAAQSIASFALTSPSAQQPRAAPSSTRKDTSSGWRFSDRGAARWRFPA